MTINFLKLRSDGSSDRSFGFVFTGVLVVISLIPFFSGGAVNLLMLSLASILFIISIALPILLRPLNIIWFHFGIILSRITNPLILGLFFYIVFSISRLFLNLFGKKMLILKFEKLQSSYWVTKPDTISSRNSFKDQF